MISFLYFIENIYDKDNINANNISKQNEIIKEIKKSYNQLICVFL